MQLLERITYKGYEIRIYRTLTGQMLRAYKDYRPCYPLLSVDYNHHKDVKMKNDREGIDILISYFVNQVDRDLLIPQSSG